MRKKFFCHVQNLKIFSYACQTLTKEIKMLNTFTQTKTLPFALMHHEPAIAEDTTLLGDVDQEWTWEPIGDLKKDQLGIYASGGNSTSQKTGMNQYDHGEFY